MSFRSISRRAHSAAKAGFVVGIALLLSGPAGGAAQMAGHIHRKAPPDFEGLKNPYWGSEEALEEGKKIYKSVCILCHGAEGKGDGPVAKALGAKPTDFTDKQMVADMKDDYWFWRITKGGGFPPFNSPMPSFEGTLSEEQIWGVMTYEHSFSHEGVHEHEGPENEEEHGGDHHMDEGH